MMRASGLGTATVEIDLTEQPTERFTVNERRIGFEGDTEIMPLPVSRGRGSASGPARTGTSLEASCRAMTRGSLPLWSPGSNARSVKAPRDGGRSNVAQEAALYVSSPSGVACMSALFSFVIVFLLRLWCLR